MDFQFVIPSTNSDLLNSNGNNYFVKQVYDAKEIPDRFKGMYCLLFIFYH